MIDNGEESLKHLKKMLSDLGGDYVIMAVDKIDFSQIQPTDTLVLSGGSKKEVIGHDEYYADEIKLIKTHPGKIIGICLGMQLIAHTFGAPIVTRNRQLFRREIRILPINQKVWESHRFAVRQTPKGFDVLARSNSDIEIIKHQTRPIYAMQFHPEMSGQVGEEILRKMLNDDLG